MSVSKSVRKKRRQSKKRNMKGGVLKNTATLSYNISFLGQLHEFPYATSEAVAMFIRLMKLKTLTTNKDPEQAFINANYKKLFTMSCRIINVFFARHGRADYCVAALQEMVPNDFYFETMQKEAQTLTTLASAVEPNKGTGLAYVIKTTDLDAFMNKLHNNEWFSANSTLYGMFQAHKVAIVDLGDIVDSETNPEKPEPVYKKEEYQKAVPDTKSPGGIKLTGDLGRPMALIVRHDKSDDTYTLHFNCHTPNPSALKIGSESYTKSILEDHYAQGTASAHMAKWAELTRKAINLAARDLLLRFFSADDLENKLTEENCSIVFSGDFNDGAGMLMDLLKKEGLTVANSKLKNIKLRSNFTPANGDKTCCSNWNSVSGNSFAPETPPMLRLHKIDEEKADSTTHPKLKTLLAANAAATAADSMLTGYDEIINSTNYSLTGDGTLSNIPNLESQIFDPRNIDVSDLFGQYNINITYQKLLDYYIRASDHMPVLSVSNGKDDRLEHLRRDESEKRTDRERAKTPGPPEESKPEESKLPVDPEMMERQDMPRPMDVAGEGMEEGVTEIQGGYRKKYKKRKSRRKVSRRKVSRRKSKRYTK